MLHEIIQSNRNFAPAYPLLMGIYAEEENPGMVRSLTKKYNKAKKSREDIDQTRTVLMALLDTL